MQLNFLLNNRSRPKRHTSQVTPSPGEWQHIKKMSPGIIWGGKNCVIPQQCSLHCDSIMWLQHIIKISDKPPSLFSLFPGCNSKCTESWPTVCALLKCHSHPQDRDSKMHRQCAGLLEREMDFILPSHRSEYGTGMPPICIGINLLSLIKTLWHKRCWRTVLSLPPHVRILAVWLAECDWSCNCFLFSK